jgi:hypothetical protein
VFLVLEGVEVPPSFDGKALSRHLERLDAVASAAGTTMPGSFLGFGDDDWFDAADGLRTAEALLAAIRPGSVKLRDKTAVRADLEALRDALRSALAAGTRFHLGIDI